MEGYFKVHRKIIDSQVFSNQTALKIWVWCLSKASYRDKFLSLKIGKGEVSVKIKAGQFIFGRYKAESELDIEGTTIYRWINKFASDAYEKMISLDVHNQYTIITICNWATYQVRDDEECTTNAQDLHKTCTTYAHKQEGKEDKRTNSFMSAEDFLELYHQLCPMLNKVKSLSAKRKDKVYSRINEMGDIETITKVLTKIGASNFCNGHNDRKWTADFDWIINNDTNWSKAYEGKYDNKKSDILFNVEKEKPTEFKEF